MKRTAPASKAEQSHSFPPPNRNCPRVLAHFSNVQLVLDEMPNFPEELQGAKKGILYLTQYKMLPVTEETHTIPLLETLLPSYWLPFMLKKSFLLNVQLLLSRKNTTYWATLRQMIFQHKDKGSTTIRFPLQLLGDCVIGEELSSSQQYIKGTSTSSQGVLTFKFIFLYGATDCLNMIQTLSSADTLREAANLQDYPTASVYTYAHPSAPRASRSLSTLPHWPPPYPGPPELPPPYSEVESSPRESQEGCCRCRALRTQEQTDRKN